MVFGREGAFLADLLQSISVRSRRLLGRAGAARRDEQLAIVELAARLISSRGEASGVALARRILGKWEALDRAERIGWFTTLAVDFGPDTRRLNTAVEAWLKSPSPAVATELHGAAEPFRQELFRRINLAPGGTAALVAMREALLVDLIAHPELTPVDADFVHLFSSWFNRGFLLLKRIDWSSPADVLEKIIRYEAVHEIVDWNELRLRLAPADRRCFAFFHPQMPDDPLIFVEVALTSGVPTAIDGLLSENRQPLNADEADTAVFYSISNTQVGLKGISLGNFLIKQVVEELAREAPNLRNFVTLSPLPGFADWLAEETNRPGSLIDAIDSDKRLAALDGDTWHIDKAVRATVEPLLVKAAAVYLVSAKSLDGRPLDPVARFHLRNGASLERINAFADLSPNGVHHAHGVMVNYRYDQFTIEENHEAYVNSGRIACSPAIRRLAGVDRRDRAVSSERQERPVP
jgi:malonyl-CoA decarboxylase